jgi:VWFA-related protein
LLVFAAVVGSQESTAFRASTRLVQINVIVRDKNGPVANLEKSDFTLTDRGKPRTISIFSIHKASALPSGPTASLPLLPSDTFSNRPLNGAEVPGSVTIILLDRLNTLIGSSQPGERSPLFNGDLALASAKQHLLKFIDAMGPTDRVAIYSLGVSLGVLSDFTTDRARLKALVEGYRATSITTREVAEPSASNVCPVNSPDGCPMNSGINSDRQKLAALSNGARANSTMAALMALSAHVAGIPGRKNLVWLTSNLALSAESAARALTGSDIAIYPIDARGLLPIAISNSDTDTSGAAMEAPPRGTPPSRPGNLSSGGSWDPMTVSNTLQVLAEETGGRASVNSNDLETAIKSAIDDGAVTYTLGFYVDEASLDEKFHELKVHVRPRGLEVRTQRGYFALKAAASGAASPLTLPTTSPLESVAIHLLARVERTAGVLSISGSVDAGDLQLEQNGDSSQGAIEIHLVQQDAAGKVLEGKHQTLRLQFTRDQYEAILKSGVFFRGTVEPKEGLTTLRVIVLDKARSTVGSLIIPVSEIK